MLSFLLNGNGYRLWDIERRTVVKSRDVIFDHGVFPYGQSFVASSQPIMVELPWPVRDPVVADLSKNSLTSSSKESAIKITDSNSSPIVDDSVNSPHNCDLGNAPTLSSNVPIDTPSTPAVSSETPLTITRKSTRVTKPLERLGNWLNAVDAPLEVDTPKTWKQLLRSVDKIRWLKAADNEFASLLGMQTWKLVPRPEKRRVIKSKWVFKVKKHADHSIQKLKAQLVAMGYSQIQGVDYDEVFSPTLRLETLRLLYSLMAINSWKGRQVDFKTAFLNGHLDKQIFMEQPPGFEDLNNPDYVCEVQRSLYGLKQAPRQWNLELHNALIKLGLSCSKYDPTLYFQLKNDKLIGAISIHVDDLSVVGQPNWVDSTISSLGKCFNIGADEELNHFILLKITRNLVNKAVYLSQDHYVEDLQQRFLPGDHYNVLTPSDSNFKDLHQRCNGEDGLSGLYPQLIGSLLWLAQCTRPDISFVVNRLSQFLRNPSNSHWSAAMRVLQYVISTKDLRLQLGGSMSVAGYSDSDWAEDREDQRLTSGYTFCLGDGAISWQLKKQATVSLSSTEAEYKAMSDSCKEGLWLRRLLCELHIRSQAAIPLHINNSGALKLSPKILNITRARSIYMHAFILFGNVSRMVNFKFSTFQLLTCLPICLRSHFLTYFWSGIVASLG
jgi:histone deacetylase 1/2